MSLLTEGVSFLTEGGLVLGWTNSVPRVDSINASPGSNHTPVEAIHTRD